MKSSGGFRLSPQQRRLWRLQSALGERPFRARARALLRGPLDESLLRAAVDDVVSRYEILRTTFPCPAGLTLPVQQVADGAAVLWHEMRDLSGLAAPEREPALDEILRTMERDPFDLARGPLLRLALARLADGQHTLLLTLPALCADAVTLRNLVRQISSSYAARAGAPADGEASDPLQYVDLAEWQNELLDNEETAVGREHWESWDPAPCRALRLPFETAETEGDRFEPLSLAVPLESGLIRSAQALAAELETSLPTLLLAAWQSLIWRLAGQPEILVGMAAECRSYEGLPESLGPLASFVPLSCRLEGGLRFLDAVTRARDAAQEMAKWQEYFRWESVADRRGLSLEDTVFPVSFAAEDRPAPWLAGPLEWELSRFEAGIDRFRLGLSVYVEDGLPAVELAWDAAALSPEDAAGLARAWAALLASAVARPETRIGELSLVGPDERRHLARAGAAGGAAAPVLVHELFLRQARRVPDRPAAVCGERSLSYAELAERAERLARLLRRHGVGPDGLVALCLERSLALPLALLGTLGAGGAYLPLEPGLPRERKSFLLADARPQAILTESRFLKDLPAAGVPVLCLDGPWEAELPESGEEPLGPAPDPASLVYVIYTSGSTGAPKGVAVEHRQLANYIQGVAERLDLPDGASSAMVSTFAADLGNTVLFPSLCGGGTLHLIPEELTSDPVALAAALERDPVDCMKITPSHLEALLAAAPSPLLLPRLCLVLGGEASRREWVEGLARLRPDLRVINHYGPTETTVGVLTHPAAPGLRTSTLPLGRPLPGTTAWLLGPDLEPLPAWFPGELYLGGAGVARGYLGRPDLTADRFVPDPLAEGAGARMYRTGDLARRLPDGTFEFIGRADHQVKIRGFRIELGEIETVLEGFPEVRRASVAALDDGSGSQRLVAYVVAEGEPPGPVELRGWLEERLPEFMIPSAFVFLDALPLNANGKVDRRALPEPDWRHLGASEEFVAPETAAEKLLAEVWAQVLGLERVGAHDNFFHLGGDSIRGIMARARAEAGGVVFSVQQLFDHPVLRDLARVLEEGASPELREERTGPFALVTEADRARMPEGVEDAYPLATLQAGMLFHSEVHQGTAIFHDLHSVHARSPFDADRMREVVRQVSLLHPVLRTSFDLASFSESLQLVHAGIRVPLEIHDLRQVPPEEQEGAVSEWLRQERQRAFDWTRPPLIAFHVHLRGEESFQFTMSFHHAILDGWSSASLLTELFQRYARLLRGEEPPPDFALALSYRDFVALERAAISSEEARSFWARRLDGAEPTRLPRLSPTGNAPGAGVRSLYPPVDPDLSERAQRAAREAGVPLKSLLLAVFLRAMGALGGTSDVLIALVSHGRPEQADGERVLGLFLNTLPFRAHLRGGSWLGLAREVFDLERRMLPFRRFPFAEMRRLQGGSLALQAAFNYLHYHVYQGAAASREIEVLGGQDYEETDFPLLTHVMLDPFSQSLRIGLGYRPAELGAREAERFADSLLRALKAMAADPASRYDTTLLSAAEQHQILVEWNDREVAGPAPCLPQRFEAQALCSPDAVAITAGKESLTYGELYRRASGMAHRLRALGVGPEVRVALCLDRTPDLVVAVLGVLAAGGAYLPLDPSYPRERLAFLLEDSDAALLLTERHLVEVLPEGGPPRIWLDEERNALAPATAGFPAGVTDPQSLAYVLYTSGSTGRPKGVQVPHSALANFLAAVAKAPGLAGSDALLAVTTLSFDIAALEIFLPLTVGARVEIAPRGAVVDGERLAALLGLGITAMQATPATWRMLLEAGWTGSPGLKALAGGEALPRDLADRLLEACGSLWNLYGPTETTIWSAIERIAPGPGPIAIGRPLDNTRIHLLSPALEPVAAGVPGELYIGGAGVSRGYLGRPDLTAERFVPDPEGEPGARLYRTGDLARHLLPDGRIEFLGRIDHQVKVRGFRIELGEIEAALSSLAGVREAVVAVREDTPGEKRLVAYVTGDVAPDALRQALRDRLPDFMVPAAVVTLSALPLTPNGKVDRKALPAPQASSLEEIYLAPRTPVEEILAALWAEILGVERVGATDHFFELGGHSLLATRVMSRLRGVFEVEMPLRDLFEAPRLADLAARVEAARRAGAAPLAPPLVPVERKGPAPLSFAQQRLWFIDQLGPGSPLYNMPVALRVEGPLDSGVLARSLGEIVRRHETLRTVFAEHEGSPVQVIRTAAPFGVSVVDLSGLAEREREALALAVEEAARPFDLAQGPLLRCVLLRLAEEDHVAALTMHHIVSDGWSMGILVREVMALYAAFAEGRPSPLPELPVQYADFAVWQQSWLQGDVLENEIAHWRRQLAGLPPRLELPTDRPRPAVQSFRGASRPVRLSPGLSRRLQALSRREGATLFMVLLAGFQALLSRCSGQQDLAVGTPVAGRNRTEIEGLIGFFVNTLVLRGDLTGGPAFRELLGRVRDTALAAHAHQDVPFERLVQDLSPERSLAHSPLFQVMLVLQNAPAQSLEIRNLRLRPVGRSAATARFDLTLTLEERGGEISGLVESNRDLFDPTTIDRLVAGYERLLENAVADPARSVAELPLLSPAELHQLSLEWNSTEAPLDTSLVQRFEGWADRTPQALAVLAPDEDLTYAELEHRANQLARHLRTLGVGIDSRVGLCAERSPEAIVAVLGILKAGAAYVPLDPAYPSERLAFLIEDTRLPVLLTQERLIASLPQTPARTLCLDADWSGIVRESGERLPHDATPGSLAYVIYTSGSTGRPKGVMVHHQGWSHLAEAQRRLFGVRPGSRVLQFASLSFDASASEIAMALGSGATLLLGPRERVLSAGELTALLRQSTVATLPPTTLAVLEPEDLPGLETLVVAGEACPPELARRWVSGRSLFNAYGPTEATVCATVQLYDGGERLPIGRPIPGSQAYVLDAWANPVPIGVAGELCVGGTGVCRGYLHRPDLTAERFIPDPLSAGERLYRTGDLARCRPDGTIEFLGRIDHQVKIRGFRIELGEIEAALSALTGVREAAVVAREDTPGDRRLVAYVAGDAAVEALRQALRERLPDSMVPAAFVTLEALPLTPNGKVDRKALPAPESTSPELVREVPESRLEKTIAAVWREALGVETIGLHDNFFDRGGHSLLLVQVQRRLSALLDRDVTMVDLFTYPTIGSLARFLSRGEDLAAILSRTPRPQDRAEGGTRTAIAIIGMAGRFPGAPDLQSFWELLRDGREAVSFFTDEELLAEGISPSLLASPSYVKAGAVLADAGLFDAAFFNLSPREAEIIDPQQRLLLECAAEALERAGYAGTARPIGVFAGTSQNTYLFNNLATRPDLIEAVGPFALNLANSRDFVATRLSYLLNLSGPSLTVQTACSTSLVAVHLACQSLIAGECELALAGGASVRVPQKNGSFYHPGGITSPDGHCRAFDASAEGTVIGQGVGVVVLKRLADALAEGDPIHAVLKGSAANNDGLLKAGFTAPSRDGQSRAIREAQLRAGVEPGSIGYVEAHGTATPLGDPVEAAALTRAFRLGTERRGFCALGSVKTNIGHLDAAAGIAGLIKTVLALENNAIPPSLHFTEPNPQIDFAASPFFVNRELREWPGEGGPRRAGVSSFGLGGTNVHAVLEEAPAAEPSGPSRPWQVLLVSARTDTALERATDDLAAHLEADPGLSLPDVAYTLRVGRWLFSHRRAVVAASREEAAAALRSRDPKRVWTAVPEPGSRAVAFLLPGVGDQYPGMARGLYDDEPVFRRELDLCAELLLPHLGLDLRDLLFAGEETAEEKDLAGPDLRALLGRGGGRESSARSLLRETRVAQPVMFALSHALARLWMSWGVEPRALLGYSLGEYTAACLAGVMELPDALGLVARRARLIGELAPGALLAVPLSEDEARARLGSELSLAAVNAPAVSVIAGPPEPVAELERQLAGEGLPSRRLQAAQAFHSWRMQPVAGELLELVRSIPLAPPRIPYLSNVTGTWIEPAQATDPGYWVSHLLSTVRFADGLAELWQEPGRILLEMGPGQTLGSLALQQIPAEGAADRAVFSALRHELDRQPDQRFLLHTLGRLWLAGAEIDASAFHGEERRRRVPLPTYPFERQRFWVERGQTASRSHKPAPETLGRLADPADWFHVPSWKRVSRPRGSERRAPGGRWLVLLDPLGLGNRLADRLRDSGCEVATARIGSQSDLGTLLAGSGAPFDHILHLWSLDAPGERVETGEELARGYDTLIALTQALVRQGGQGPAEICVIANGLCDVERRDPLHPGKATLLGPLRVIPQEHPQISCRLIDVDPGEIGPDLERLLLAELGDRPPEPVIALRGPHRWVPVFEPAPLPPAAGRPTRLRQGGTYLITGGLGGLGLALAGHLARTAGARLALVGRSALPEERLHEVLALEDAGAEVLSLTADVTDAAAMRRSVATVRQRFGRIDGVFHAAGVPGAGLLQLKTRETARLALAPKVEGTLVLEAALADDPPDFLVLYSSISALLGGVGQVDYSAANAFLGAFARSRSARGGTPVIAIDWCEWRWDRWTESRVASPEIREGLRRQRETFGLTFAEGMEALGRILESGFSEVVVSTRNLSEVIRTQLSAARILDGLAELSGASPGRKGHPRPALQTPWVAPSTETEEKVAALWEELLGIEPIGIHDDFFQLGGHSLQGLKLVSTIHARLGVELPLRTLFEAPTIAELAAAITARNGSPRSPGAPEPAGIQPASPEAMLYNLDRFSEDEIDSMLVQMLAEEGGQE